MSARDEALLCLPRADRGGTLPTDWRIECGEGRLAMEAARADIGL
jgi:hypothetical protein